LISPLSKLLICYQALGVATPVKARNHVAQNMHEDRANRVGLKDRFVAVTARDDVVKSDSALES